MRPLPLVVPIAAALGSASAMAVPPTQPGDLRADVYSGTAAELFWSRSSDPDGAVRAYEVRRDGELVATLDGLSYFTEALSDGQASAFTITAIDVDGERSTPASVSVVGGDRGGVVGAGGGRPTPPANLTSSVYSSSAAEVFWDRSDQPGLTYEVVVDGGPVVTTSGTSAFLSGLDNARGRGVDVVAIDANGQRSGAANVTLGGSSGGDPTPPVIGDAPAAPAGLRGELYSSSAGEVFWDRVPGSNLSYEVSLDGEVVATTDGTSYFIGGRSGLDGASVDVVAIGADGARSSVSSATLSSGGSSIPDPGIAAPPAPANPRVEVYSDSAGEVFWDRAPASANVIGTEVVRNGIVLGSVEGNSFFDRLLLSGQEYVYELVAVNRDGIRSPVASVSTSEHGQQTDSTISATNSTAILSGVSEIIGRNASARVVGDVAALFLGYDEMASGRSVGDFNFVTDENGRTVERAEIVCSAGGSYRYDEFGGARAGARMVIDGCSLDGTTYSGTLTASDRQTGSAASYDGFSVISAGRDITIESGDVERFTFLGEPVTRETVEGLSYSLATPEGTVSIDDMTMTLRDDATDSPRTSLDVEFDVTAPWTNGESLSVVTEETFVDGDTGDGRYLDGRLRISDDDGNSILVDVGNGDPSTFDVTVSAQGSSMSEIISWGETFTLPCVGIDPEQFGTDVLDGCTEYPRLVAF